MGGMTLYHHRATCRQCRRRITADRGKCQWKVRGAENRDGTDRLLHHHNLGACGWLAVWQCGIMAAVKVVAFQDMLGKQPQLTNRAAALTLQSPSRQAGFSATHLSDRIRTGLNFIRDSMQKASPIRPRGIAVGPESVFCGLGGPINQINRSDKIAMGWARRGFGLELLAASNPLSCDQMLSMGFKCHFSALSRSCSPDLGLFYEQR
jgi:hypothetical protein